MAKAVFRPGEAKVKDEKFVLSLMKDYSPVEEEIEDVVEEYTGPTVEELKREAGAVVRKRAAWCRPTRNIPKFIVLEMR